MVCGHTAQASHPPPPGSLSAGTIRKCQKALIAYNRAMLVCMLEQCTTEGWLLNFSCPVVPNPSTPNLTPAPRLCASS